MRRVVQCGGPPKESLNKSSAERVAVKIGMIARRATKVVACAFKCSDAKERNDVSADFAATRMGRGFASDLLCQAPSEGRPKDVGRGTRKAGSGSVGSERPRKIESGASASRFEVASSFPAKPPSRLRGICSAAP